MKRDIGIKWYITICTWPCQLSYDLPSFRLHPSCLDDLCMSSSRKLQDYNFYT